MNALIVGAISVFFWIFLIVCLEAVNLVRGKSRRSIHNQDGIIELLLWISFFSIPFLFQLSGKIENIFYFFVIYAFTGTYLEFMGGWIWYKLMGTRLYRYYKRNLLGFTSIYMPPFWGGAGLFFLSIFQLFKLDESRIGLVEFLNVFLFWGMIGLIISFSLMAFSDLLKNKINRLEGFTWIEYSLFVNFLWFGIISTAIHFRNIDIIFYFLITSSVGMILEGLLSKGIHKIFGENFWIYRRFSMFKGGTSLLILPIWSVASLLGLVLIKLILY